jgi:hypothetical protein
MNAKDPLSGQVALVAGGGTGLGRDIALALAARGVRVVVTGRDEKALAETVGEIACGGGKARHLAGDVDDPGHVRAAMQKAVDVFGAPGIVVAGTPGAFTACAHAASGPAKLLAVLDHADLGDPEWRADHSLGELVAALALELHSRRIRCYGIREGSRESVAPRMLLLLTQLLSAPSEPPGGPLEERA